MFFVSEGESDLPAEGCSDSRACFWRRFGGGRFADERSEEMRSKRDIRMIEGRARVAAKRLEQPSAEPLACLVRRAERWSRKDCVERISGRDPARKRPRKLRAPSHRAATSSGRKVLRYQTPNQALEPTRVAGASPASAGIAPATRVAHL